jgi:hypothetical protein
MSGTVGGPSLDLGKNNSTDGETSATTESRFDCRDVYENLRYEDQETGATGSYRCDQWDCYCCAYRMRCNLVEEIERVCTENPEISRFLTLTLDPDLAPKVQANQHRYLTKRWNALRTAITREFGDLSYIWIREEQDSGLPHIHILVSRYLPQNWVSDRWEALGGGQVVDIRSVERVQKAAHYVGKYLTKNALSGLPDGIRRYGSSQDLDLDVRGGGSNETTSWELVMDDYQIRRDGEPLTRGVTRVDFTEQLANGGPLGIKSGKDPPTNP